LYTKPHAERQVSQALLTRGIEIYLPTVQVWRARRRRVEEEPLFACYAFARIDLQQVGLSAVAWTPGLRHIVSCEGTPIVVPDAVIAYIHTRANQFIVHGLGRLQPGDRVRIVQGPLKDLEAVFERHLSGYERAQVLVHVLGHLTRCDIPVEWLEQN
jgi:transcriptional antiterminator RfaH